MSVSFEEDRKFIESRFKTQMATLDPTVSVTFDNVILNPPQDGTCWVWLSVRPVIAGQHSMGGTTNIYRHHGQIVCMVYAPLNTGTKKALQVADNLGTIFRSEHFNGILCRAPMVKVLGEAVEAEKTNNKRWFLLSVTIPFQRDSFF